MASYNQEPSATKEFVWLRIDDFWQSRDQPEAVKQFIHFVVSRGCVSWKISHPQGTLARSLAVLLIFSRLQQYCSTSRQSLVLLMYLLSEHTFFPTWKAGWEEDGFPLLPLIIIIILQPTSIHMQGLPIGDSSGMATDLDPLQLYCLLVRPRGENGVCPYQNFRAGDGMTERRN